MAILLPRVDGLADSKWSGTEFSVAECVGLDLHSTPGLVKVNQKLTKDSGATVDEFCRVAVAASNGYTFWFSYTSGKIWARTAAGSWSLAHTTTPAAGSAGCLGAMEYNGRIYWATQSRLHFIPIANADDSWTGETEDFGTFDVTDSEWHPMAIQDLRLFIGDGNQIAEVDGTTFSSNALDLKTPYRIKCLAPYDLDLLIGTYVDDDVNRTEIVRWDTVATSWNTSDPIEETGINAFIRDDNFMYVQAGKSGSIYVYDGQQLVPFRRIPGDFSNVKFGEVYPDSATVFRGVPVFGFSNSPSADNSTGNPAKQGLYRFGSYSRDYPKIMDLSWVISQDKTTGLEIGGVLVTGNGYDLMVAWKDGSNYGVDKIDYSNKYASAYFETRMLLEHRRNENKTLGKVAAYYESLPASTGFTFSYQVNHAGSYTALTSVTNSKKNEVFAELSVEDVGALQVKCAFTVNSNDAPTLEAFDVAMHGEESE